METTEREWQVLYNFFLYHKTSVILPGLGPVGKDPVRAFISILTFNSDIQASTSTQIHLSFVCTYRKGKQLFLVVIFHKKLSFYFIK